MEVVRWRNAQGLLSCRRNENVLGPDMVTEIELYKIRRSEEREKMWLNGCGGYRLVDLVQFLWSFLLWNRPMMSDSLTCQTRRY